MSRTLKSIVILFVVLFVILFALDFAKLPEAETVTAAANPSNAGAQPAEFTGLTYLPLVMVERGQAELVVVVDPAAELVKVDKPIRIEKPVTITDPCDSRNNPDDNPDPHPCPKRNSGKADEHNAPWPTPEPSPEQPKAHKQQSQPDGGKRGK